MADKTATIKLRLSDDEKANWEAQADADGVTLSSLIRHRMNHPTTRADGVVDELPTYGPEDMTPEELATTQAIIDAIEARQAAPRGIELLDDVRALNLDDDVPQPFVIEAGGLIQGPRRTAQCEHGRPQYVFCPTCDA